MDDHDRAWSKPTNLVKPGNADGLGITETAVFSGIAQGATFHYKAGVLGPFWIKVRRANEWFKLRSLACMVQSIVLKLPKTNLQDLTRTIEY